MYSLRSKIAMALLAASLIFTGIETAHASNPAVGTVISGYTFGSDGYWWNNNVAFKRVAVRQKIFTSRCTYYWQTTYQWQRVSSYQAPKVSYQDENWRKRLLKIAESRDRYQQQAKRSALEHNEFLEAVRVLGLDDYADYTPRYATNPYNFQQAQSSQSYVPNAQQGSSVYGYSYSTLADLYGSNDLSTLYQQAGRLTERAQSLAGDANTQFQSTVQLEGDNRARVAMILAKAQLLRAADTPEAHVQQKLEVFGNKPLQGQSPAQIATSLSGLMANKCTKCHSDGNAQGRRTLFPSGVDLTQYASYSVAQKRRTVEVVLAGDMPKNGQPLGIDEMGLFYADLLNCVGDALGSGPAQAPAQQTVPPIPQPPTRSED